MPAGKFPATILSVVAPAAQCWQHSRVTATPKRRSTLWSPWSLAIAGLWGVASLVGLSTLAAPPGEVGPLALVLSVVFGVVAAGIMIRAPSRRVIVDGADITRVRLLSRQTLHMRRVVEVADAEGPASLLWSTSVPVIVLDDGTEVALTELAGYDGLGRRNRRVQSARAALSAATSRT